MLGLFALAAVCPFALPAADSASQASDGKWKLLFDGKTTDGWRTFKKTTFPEKGWDIQDGWLHCLGRGGNKGGGDIITGAEFGSFELEWDWKQATNGNSGVKYFVLETRPAVLGHEYQMIDDARNHDAKVADGKRATASFYDVLKPTVATPTKPPGEINHSRILVKGNHIEHWLNGTKVLQYESGSDEVKAAIAQSKFKDVAGFENSVKGHILLQDHNSEVWFRDIKIRELSPD
jgi:hypothetical protein